MTQWCGDGSCGCRACAGDDRNEMPELLRMCFGSAIHDEQVVGGPQLPRMPEGASYAPHVEKLEAAEDFHWTGAGNDPSQHWSSKPDEDGQISLPQKAEWQQDESATTAASTLEEVQVQQQQPEELCAGIIPEAPRKEQQKPPPPRPAATFMDEKAVLKEATWCLFCCCSGCGIGRAATPRLLLKCICCRHDAQAVQCAGPSGCLACLCSLTCCHFLCQAPCRNGTPRCMMCGEMYFGYHTKRPPDAGADDINKLLLEGFSPLYCCCTGCSFTKEKTSCRSVSKCACCNFLCESGSPFDNDGCLSTLLTCWNVYCQCRIPPKWEGNPICACFGKRWKSHKQDNNMQVSANQAPSMQEMA